MALATVVSTWGSAPRPRGSHMLIAADGRFEGSVSGGCVEGEVLIAGADVIARGIPRRLRYGVTDPAAWEIGLPCGGEIELLVQPVSEAGFPAYLFDNIAGARLAGSSPVPAALREQEGPSCAAAPCGPHSRANARRTSHLHVMSALHALPPIDSTSGLYRLPLALSIGTIR